MSKRVITFALAALLAVPLIAGPGEQAPPPELILKEVLQLTDTQIGAIQQDVADVHITNRPGDLDHRAAAGACPTQRGGCTKVRRGVARTNARAAALQGDVVAGRVRRWLPHTSQLS